MKNSLIVLLFFLVFSAFQSFIYSLDKSTGPDKSIYLDVGGNINDILLLGNKDQNLNICSFKPFVNVILSEDYNFYTRGKALSISLLKPPADAPYKKKYYFDLDASYLRGVVNPHLSFTLGRNYFKLGQGFLFNNLSDGLEAIVEYGIFKGTLIANYTGLLLRETNPFNFNQNDFMNTLEQDKSETKLGGAKRIFVGMTPGVYVFDQYIYLISLCNIDLIKNSKEKYSSYYNGIGVNGDFLNDFGYEIEGVYETGTSPSINADDNDSKIKAYAGLLTLSYIPKSNMNLKIDFMFGYSSGDKDRDNATVSNANVSGDDNLFKSFGLFYKGFVVRPEFSNIKMFGLTYAMTPLFFMDNSSVKRCQMGLQSFSYFKTLKEGKIAGSFGISNSFASEKYTSIPENFDKAYLGTTLEFFMRWMVLSDLYVNFEYGYFFQNFDYITKYNDDGSFEKTKKTFMIMTSVNLFF